MAFRRETIKRQFGEARQAFLEPGEQGVAEAFTISGPSPWLMGVLGVIVMLILGQRYYFVTVTDRRVLFMKASLMTGRPKGLAWADPRSTVTLEDVTEGKLWSRLFYLRPGVKKLRLNFHRIWRDDMNAVVNALRVPTSPPPPPQPPPPAPTA
jgi:hypothetical protein